MKFKKFVKSLGAVDLVDEEIVGVILRTEY